MRSRLYFKFALRIQFPLANEKNRISVACRATGSLQLKPSGSGDENRILLCLTSIKRILNTVFTVKNWARFCYVTR